MTELLKIGAAAELLAKLEPYEDVPPAYFAAQLRDFVSRGVVIPAGFIGSGARRAALLGPEQLCIARLLSVLTRLGIRAEHIAQAANCMRNAFPTSGPSPEWSYTYGGLNSLLVDGIKRRERWYFRLWVEPQPKGTAGLGQLFGDFRPDQPIADMPFTSGMPCIIIDVSTLFEPLLRDYMPRPLPIGKPEPNA